MRIWGKIIDDNKITQDYVYEIIDEFKIDDIPTYVSDICGHLDLPTPVLLISHIKNFLLFNSTHFTQDDFVESFKHNKFQIEIIKD